MANNLSIGLNDSNAGYSVRLVLYAAATRTDTTAPLALLAPNSDSRGGFAVTGHVSGNLDTFDALQDARQAVFLGKKGPSVMLDRNKSERTPALLMTC